MMYSELPEHLCPSKMWREWEQVSRPRPGYSCRSGGDTDTVCTNCWSPTCHLWSTSRRLTHNWHTTADQEVNHSSSTPPFPRTLHRCPICPTGDVSPRPDPRLCLLNCGQRDGRQNTELWLPTPCTLPTEAETSCLLHSAWGNILQSFLVFSLSYCI